MPVQIAIVTRFLDVYMLAGDKPFSFIALVFDRFNYALG